MEREPRFRIQVREPGALPVGAWHAADVDAAVDDVERDLDAARQSGPPAGCGDVDDAVAGESASNVVVHWAWISVLGSLSAMGS